MRKICVLTSNRSDWSKLCPVAQILKQSPDVELSVIALGSHILEEFGRTIDEIKLDFPEVFEISTIVSGDSLSAMADSVGFGLVKVASLLSQIKPQICVVHGDRFDAFSAVVAANLMDSVVAHIEGGELSGTVDGYLRHAMTKLSHLHFACSGDAAYRIKAMGEMPAYVFLTGCPSYARLFSVKDTSWIDSDISTDFPTLKPRNYILSLMHPCVTEHEQSVNDYETMLRALFELRRPTILLYPNVDPGNKQLIKMLHKYQKIDKQWTTWLTIKTHIQPSVFAVLMCNAAVMVGNSSAGIRESCVYGTPTLNIGNRQKGRLQPANVTTHQTATHAGVVEWIKMNYDKRFESSSCFGDASSPARIAQILQECKIHASKRKLFTESEHIVPKSMPTKATASAKQTQCAPRVLGIITARGGSKGIPRKNILDLAGKPLIQYTIEAALSSKFLDRCILSTDCEEIARVAAQAGCEVPFMRPKELAEDTSAHMDCVHHAINTLAEMEGYEADYAMILQPTSPFRSANDIDSSIAIVRNTSCDAVVSVSKMKIPLVKTHRIDPSGCIQPYAESFPSVSRYIRRQDNGHTYAENGAIFIQKVSSILEPCDIRCGSLFTADARAYVMPAERSIDIDEPLDLEIARAVMLSRSCSCNHAI